MSKLAHALLVLVLPIVLVAASIRASDDDKKPVVEAKQEGNQGGNWFTHFWTHRVGDTIGHGLKTGARKIDHAFTGGSKEKDEAEKRGSDSAPATPSVPAAPSTVTKPDSK